MKESALYPIVRKTLEDMGVAVSKIPGSVYNMGLPDFICTDGGRAVHIEVKIRQAGKSAWGLTELQRSHLVKHRIAGAKTCVLLYDATDKRWHMTAFGPGEHQTLSAMAAGHGALPPLLRTFLQHSMM